MIIDMHTHILPRCDHGSNSTEMSLRQLKEAKEAGVEVIVATPHFYLNRDTVDAFVQRRETCFQELAGAAKNTNLADIRIIKGAEVTLMTGLDEIPDLNRLCIEGTNSIMIEMPMRAWTNWEFTALYNIISKHKLKPLIAHIDRYAPEQAEKLMRFDIPFQINAESVVSFSGRRRIMKHVYEGDVAALGSDMHLDGKMYRQFKRALKKLGDYVPEIMDRSAEIAGLK